MVFSFKWIAKWILCLIIICTYNPKDKIDPFQKSGVYELNWNDYAAKYMGKTGRSLNQRLKEHIRAYNNKTDNSNFAINLHEKKNHKFIKDSGVKLIHHVENSLKLNIYDAFEVIKSFKSNPDFCLNDEINISNSPILNLFPSITEKTITHRHYWKNPDP